MAENSAIEWTHHTFNPWIGCQKVGPGCDHCYAEALMDTRYGRVEWGPHGSRSRTSAANWRQPLKWDRDAAAAGVRRRVFCASLADVFDNHKSILPEWRDDLWTLIAKTPNLDWMLLTKRPGNIANMLPVPFDFDKLYPNVWLGCTVVNQAEADREIPKLLAVPAKVRFLSMEPLLGRVYLQWAFPDIRTACCHSCGSRTNAVGGRCPNDGSILKGEKGIDLVIVGGESGHGARPMHPDWVRSLRDQCQAAGVAFFFKQWGEWAPGTFVHDAGADYYDGPVLYCDADDGDEDVSNFPGIVFHPETHQALKYWTELPHEYHDGRDVTAARRVGKRRAGRTLDGRTWDQMPGDAA